MSCEDGRRVAPDHRCRARTDGPPGGTSLARWSDSRERYARCR
ncbi:hypothetical protein [Streptomyces sp. NPDC054784]